MSLENMKTRINYYGGAVPQDRMIQGKWKSMLAATRNSYQSAKFLKYPDDENFAIGLFNPVTNNMDSDTKLISVGFDSGYKVGDIFLWDNTKTYWICYNQDLTELAYFRGKCRRCDYKVKWVDGDRKLRETYLSVVGPNQPDFRTYNPGYGLSIDTPTANLVVLTSNNEQNKKYFNQNQKFLLQGVTYKIHQVDTLSMPGVIEMYCQQDYTNLIEDDVEENIQNNWNIQPVIPQYDTQYGIEGPVSIKPLFPYSFKTFSNNGRWFVLENEGVALKHQLPVSFEYKDNDKEVVVTWNNPKSGAFTLCYETPGKVVYKRHIVVESLM